MIKVVREGLGLITIENKDIRRTDIFFSDIEEVEIKKEEIKKEKEKVEVIEKELDIKELRSKLKEKGVKFFAGAKDDKIIELARENNII